MKILVGGGCKNGKSTYAQSLARRLADGDGLFYAATMAPRDAEDDLRVARHRQEREGWGFVTLEQPVDIAAIGPRCAGGAVLLDSTTALLANEMFPSGAPCDPAAGERVTRQLLELCAAAKHIVLVSDYIYSDAQRYDEATQTYRRALAGIDRALAEVCDVVCEISFGGRIFHKGREPQ